ncbi:THUMP domain-containing class I SAM-dependent RNA methyltransferase [Candidatus Protochlamydia amoebophila]|uniref:Putative RNA methyltransferase slr0064 n=1 Tax=Candidatus Protochlamydia amoebophila TaxID=362787 RepID=A0A0C1JPE6_9BACT|nr:THUMP domain-containing protein [Candidatus Protochlamydia amoebophila]KIC72406.1 putative RNA methyltransferase slr0064 [Candidatus Protochlamydia amoebophila]
MNGEKKLLFVSCASALEPLLLEELRELGLTDLQTGYRGVFINQWNWADIYKINYASRLATRVLLPLSRFRCFDRKSLYRHIYDIDWSFYLKEGNTFAIDANVHHRELRNSLFAAQVVKDAICDQLRHKVGRRPSVDVQQPHVQLNLYIQHSLAIISFDTSGTPLHKRGYRQETVEAPLQETLAAAILRLAKYSADKVFLDPCCGSGTLLIEAALMASQTPPGYLRQKWGFMNHPDYQANEWLKVRNRLDEHRKTIQPGHLFGIDINKSAVWATKTNLKAAGFGQAVEVLQADFREFSPTVPPDLIVTNPPHGKRLEEEDQLRPFYRSLGDFMKKKTARPAQGFVFTGNLELAKEVGLAASKRHVLNNGGIDSRLLAYELY